MKTYNIAYNLLGIHNIQVLAKNKEEAYDKAVYELIPEKEGELPYSAWVESVIYKNGNVRFFNTSEGNPY